MVDRKTGSCHCGSVKFEVTLRDGLKNARRCNCSLCRRKGAIMADIDKVQSTIDWFPKTTLRDGLKKMWDAMENGNGPAIIG